MQAPVLSPQVEASSPDQAGAPREVAQAPPMVGPGRLKLWAMAIGSGLLLYLSYFPVGWGWLGWVALVPLLVLVRVETGWRRRYFCAWLAGTTFFWPAIAWMTVADVRMIACWAMLCFYCSLYFPAAVFLARFVDRALHWPLLVTFPAVWTAVEYLRCFVLTGFPWYLLAHSQHDFLPLIQIADIGGAFAVSFLLASVNALAFEGLTRHWPIRSWLGLPQVEPGRCCQGFALQLGWVGVMLAATLAYGEWRLSQDTCRPGPRLAILQGNVDQRLRIVAHRSPEAKAKVQASYFDLCLQAAALDPPPTLIVWPETSYPSPWVTVATGAELLLKNKEFRKELALAQDYVCMIGPAAKTSVLLGLNTEVHSEKAKLGESDGPANFNTRIDRFNSALLIEADGKPALRYDKIHRVPFGEYVPFRDWLPFMNALAPYDFDYSIKQGDRLTRFPLGTSHFGVLVCYEDTDPFMAREYGIKTGDGPAVDFLLNISNDGWFDGSCEHEEHLAISRFRAIETRRALARAVNMGISAVIDSNGRVLEAVKLSPISPKTREVWQVAPDAKALAVNQWHAYKQTEGILVVDVPLDRRTSIYSAWGDWLAQGCLGLIGIGIAWRFGLGQAYRWAGKKAAAEMPKAD